LAWTESYEKVHRISGRFERTILTRFAAAQTAGAGGRVNAFVVDREEETMRSSLARALVATSAIVGIAAGGLAGASASVAASQPVTKPAVSSQRVAPLAVNNLGLNTARAKNWQSCLNAWGFNAGTEDGQLGTNSWKAAQRMLNAWGYNAGTEDGIVGTNTIRALQKFLNAVGENAGTADGIAGPQTRAAFWNYNATGC
jgi:lysozyme family protein